MFIIDSNGLDSLIVALKADGFTVVGPTVRDGAIIYDTIESVASLPQGWTDIQEAGLYRLYKEEKSSMFEYVVGPSSWKRFLFPPKTRLFSTTKVGKSFEVESENSSAFPKYAFLGVRPCEIQALALHDKVFLDGPYADSAYASKRKAALLVAVQCVRPSGTCFCTSMGTGPHASTGFDLALTELCDDERHDFFVEIGSEEGMKIMKSVPYRTASADEEKHPAEAWKQAADLVGRHMDISGLPQILNENFDHAHWDNIARRCLACANCTMVCPTCFCSTVEDVTDLTGDHAERWRRWDSCFTGDFTRIAGGNIRMSTRARYRQWMMHKLSHWVEQFGVMGCVGCGRCITWCPAGIDITAEAARFREMTTATTIV
jgi:sulfhydrogenase subunit beta (sulfur reductase)